MGLDISTASQFDVQILGHVITEKSSSVSIFRVNPFMPHGLCYLNSLDRSFSNRRGVWLFFLLLLCFIEISVFNANSVDPDPTSHSAASDLGLYCLLLSRLWITRHKWVSLHHSLG